MADVFVPLNSFKSVVTSLTGEEDVVYVTPSGVSTIILSAQVTNAALQSEEITIKLDSNRLIPVPQLDDVINTGSFFSSSALLELNREFLKKEASAYVGFINNLQDTPFRFTSSIYEARIDTVLNGVLYDVENGGTLRSKKTALSFYDKNGNILINESAQITASYDAINYVNVLAQQILENESVTGSVDVVRLYQTTITQSFDENLVAESGSKEIISQLFTIISDTIYDPIREEQEAIELVKNFPIPPGDSFSPVVAGKLVLEEDFGLVFSGSTELRVILSILESANE
jgi:hypothetical protein